MRVCVTVVPLVQRSERGSDSRIQGCESDEGQLKLPCKTLDLSDGCKVSSRPYLSQAYWCQQTVRRRRIVLRYLL